MKYICLTLGLVAGLPTKGSQRGRMEQLQVLGSRFLLLTLTHHSGLCPGSIVATSKQPLGFMCTSAHPWNVTDKDLHLYIAPTHCVAWDESLNLSGLPFPHA